MTSGNATSDPSNLDIATMVDFTPLAAGVTRISLAHFTEILRAVNAVRTATGVLDAESWSAMMPPGVPVPSVGGMIARAHITSLRTNLNEALNVFGLPLPPYTDALDRPTTMKVIHLQQLKERTQ